MLARIKEIVNKIVKTIQAILITISLTFVYFVVLGLTALLARLFFRNWLKIWQPKRNSETLWQDSQRDDEHGTALGQS